METLRSTLKQLEAQNQELQRQSASLDKDLLAERAMKEQKIKVKMSRIHYALGETLEKGGLEYFTIELN